MTEDPDAAIKKIEGMRNLLAFLLVGAFIMAMGALFLIAIPDKNEQLLTYMLGQLSGMALTALGFYFVNKVGQDAVDAKRVDNTSKALDAIASAQHSIPPSLLDDEAGAAADQVADAAKDEASEIKSKKR